MRKNTLLGLVVILLLTGCQLKLPVKLPFVPTPPPTACPGQTVGVLIGADTDPIAVEQRAGYELALQEINAEGGPGGCEISLVYQPETSTGTQNQIHRAVRTLVEDDKTIAILGGTTSSASMYASSLVNYFSTPLLVPATGGSHVLPNENHWAFRLNAGDDVISGAVFDLVKQELGVGKKFALVFEDSTQGHDIAVSAASALGLYEMVLSGYLPYNPASTDFQELIDDIQAAKPDVLYLILSQPDDATAILQAFSDAEMPLPLLTIAHGGGFLSYDFLNEKNDKVDPLAENLILAAQWTGKSQTKAGKALLAAFNAHAEENDLPVGTPTIYSLAAYKSLHLIADTLATGLEYSTAAWDDMPALRDILRQELAAYQENSPFWGQIDFDTAGQDQTGVTLIQFLNREPVVVYPPDEADQQPVINLSALEEETEETP